MLRYPGVTRDTPPIRIELPMAVNPEIQMKWGLYI